MRSIGYFNTQKSNGTTDLVEQKFKEFCIYNLHQMVQIFPDDFSGTDIKSSDGFQSAIHFLNENKGGYLFVVPNALHLGNDLEEVARNILYIINTGASISCYDENFPDPIQNAVQLFGASNVSLTRSQNIKKAMRARALEGKPMGRPPYGYKVVGDTGKLQIVSEESRVVELLFRLFTKENMGLRLIAEYLNERKIKTRRDARWNIVSIREILKNSVYIGTYSRLGVSRTNVHTPIISGEMFKTAQDIRDSRKPFGRVRNVATYLLSGFLICGYCGNTMIGSTKTQRWKRTDQKRVHKQYRYYQCQSKTGQSTCDYHTWKADLLDQTVLGQLRYVVLDKIKRQGSYTFSEVPDDSRVVTTEERNAYRRFVNAMLVVSKGQGNFMVLKRALDELDLSRKKSVPISDLDTDSVMNNWDSFNDETLKAILDIEVKRVRVMDTKVELISKFA